MKAIIMSHEDGGTYVMDREGSFRFVKGYSSQPIGKEIEVREWITARQMRVAVLAACLTLFLALGSFGVMWNEESYSVYADINPSVELVFNNLNQLKEAKPLNKDGADLLKDIKLRGNPAEVIVSLINAATEKGYIGASDEQPEVLITVTARGGKAPEEYAEIISAALEKNNMGDFVTVEVCDKDFRDMAAELSVSPGKLKMAERMFASDQSVSVEDYANMSVKELMENIKIIEENGIPQAGKEKQDNPNKGPGNNSGNTSKPDNPNALQEQEKEKEEVVTGEPESPNTEPGGNDGNSGNGESEDPSITPGSGSNGVDNEPKEDNDNKGPGNNSGSNEPKEPKDPKGPNDNKGPGNNSGNNDPKEPKDPNDNKGPGNNSGNNDPKDKDPKDKDPKDNDPKDKDPKDKDPKDKDPKDDNPNKGSGNNSGNSGKNKDKDKGGNHNAEIVGRAFKLF